MIPENKIIDLIKKINEGDNIDIEKITYAGDDKYDVIITVYKDNTVIGSIELKEIDEDISDVIPISVGELLEKEKVEIRDIKRPLGRKYGNEFGYIFEIRNIGRELYRLSIYRYNLSWNGTGLTNLYDVIVEKEKVEELLNNFINDTPYFDSEKEMEVIPEYSDYEFYDYAYELMDVLDARSIKDLPEDYKLKPYDLIVNVYYSDGEIETYIVEDRYLTREEKERFVKKLKKILEECYEYSPIEISRITEQLMECESVKELLSTLSENEIPDLTERC